jgi:CRISPR-associated protein Csx3
MDSHPVIHLKTLAANYQVLEITSIPPNQKIRPEAIAQIELPPDLDLTREVVLFGQMPTWLYGVLIDHCRVAPWIACFSAPEGGAIVVHSRVAKPAIGDLIPIALQRPTRPAILIGGPPDSGKSIFSNALRLSLNEKWPEQQIFLQRANWDGEGNWSHESRDRDFAKRLIAEHERRIHEHENAAELIPEYFRYHTRATANLRQLVNLVLVDVGGKVQPEKLPLVKQCTHYIIISKEPRLVQEWHDMCQPHLKPLAVIHSVLEPRSQIFTTEPFLEIIAGPWIPKMQAHCLADQSISLLQRSLNS